MQQATVVAYSRILEVDLSWALETQKRARAISKLSKERENDQLNREEQPKFGNLWKCDWQGRLSLDWSNERDDNWVAKQTKHQESSMET